MAFISSNICKFLVYVLEYIGNKLLCCQMGLVKSSQPTSQKLQQLGSGIYITTPLEWAAI